MFLDVDFLTLLRLKAARSWRGEHMETTWKTLWDDVARYKLKVAARECPNEGCERTFEPKLVRRANTSSGIQVQDETPAPVFPRRLVLTSGYANHRRACDLKTVQERMRDNMGVSE